MMALVHSGQEASVPTEQAETPILVLPERRMTELADLLVDITAAIDAVDPELTAHGCLGGAHGYGAHWSSEVFQMRPFCWCESESCPWCMGCDCPSNSVHYFVDGAEVTYEKWADFYKRNVTADIHTAKSEWERQSNEANRRRTTRHDPVCGYCVGGIHEGVGFVAGRGAPNFWHKPSGLKVWWYKYIGRGDEAICPTEPDLTAIRADCFADIVKATTAISVGTERSGVNQKDRTTMTNRRELADRLEAATVQSNPPWQSGVKAADLTEAARILRSPDPLLEEAVGLLRRWQSSLPSEALEDITDAFIARATRLDAERKGGEDG